MEELQSDSLCTINGERMMCVGEQQRQRSVARIEKVKAVTDARVENVVVVGLFFISPRQRQPSFR